MALLWISSSLIFGARVMSKREKDGQSSGRGFANDLRGIDPPPDLDHPNANRITAIHIPFHFGAEPVEKAVGTRLSTASVTHHIDSSSENIGVFG
ncbi:hypothetical protein N7450_009556 [Penicillium hetheringtonii]|uniref:Uncharacterized protein n=1 Tax=Penicillium hetheringtonii TaxID=911720 RepID=A0AAD6GLJ5_9EURO|nr:hypothetical protein N7450_009556 [Penicillium hetheringtonii]